jgi:hypothetical protein
MQADESKEGAGNGEDGAPVVTAEASSAGPGVSAASVTVKREVVSATSSAQAQTIASKGSRTVHRIDYTKLRVLTAAEAKQLADACAKVEDNVADTIAGLPEEEQRACEQVKAAVSCMFLLSVTFEVLCSLSTIADPQVCPGKDSNRIEASSFR